MKNILNTQSKLNLSLSQIFIVTAFILVSSLFATTYAVTNKPYETQITFDKSKATFSLNDKKVEIEPGLAKCDLSALNENPNPELIKGFMQSIASEYGVDWKLVYAIGYHESANYNSSLARSNNNYFGRKASSSGYASWATPEEAIRNQFEYLKGRYFDRGLDTPVEINRVYAEDMSWHYKVESVMASL